MDDLEGILYGTVEDSKMVQAQTKVTTTVGIKDGAKVEEIKHEEKVLEKKLLVDEVGKKPAYLSVKYSTTIPLGDFRMCRVEKSIFVPVGIEASPEIRERIQSTNNWACSLLESLMEKEVSEAMAEKNKKPEVKEDFSLG